MRKTVAIYKKKLDHVFMMAKKSPDLQRWEVGPSAESIILILYSGQKTNVPFQQ